MFWQEEICQKKNKMSAPNTVGIFKICSDELELFILPHPYIRKCNRKKDIEQCRPRDK